MPHLRRPPTFQIPLNGTPYARPRSPICESPEHSLAPRPTTFVNSYVWHDFVGNVGVAIIILTYLGLQLGRLDGRSLSYAVANAVGAGLVLVSLVFDFNLSAFIIEAFWVAISLVGVARGLRERRRSAATPEMRGGE